MDETHESQVVVVSGEGCVSGAIVVVAAVCMYLSAGGGGAGQKSHQDHLRLTPAPVFTIHPRLHVCVLW